MIGGQQNETESKVQDNVNPQKQQQKMEVEPLQDANVQKQIPINLFKVYRDIDKQVQEIVNASGSNFVEPEVQANQSNLQQQESRPSPPIDQSISQSQSNPKSVKNKQRPLSNELLRLTKKSTTNFKQRQRKQRQRKIRCYVTDFQPYLPSFMDEIHKQHHKTIIRIGQKYQAHIDSQPEFESIHRPMNHLRIWKGSEQKFSKDALKKFRQIYGQHRTQEELILLKHRLQSQSWNDLIKQMVAQKQAGKKSSLVVASNSLSGTSLRTK